MNKDIYRQALDDILVNEVAISPEESEARRAERRIRQVAEKQQEKERYKRQRQIFLGKREKLYKSALKSILDDVKTKTKKQLREYDDVDFAWDVNPNFMNCSYNCTLAKKMQPQEVLSVLVEECSKRICRKIQSIITKKFYAVLNPGQASTEPS